MENGNPASLPPRPPPQQQQPPMQPMREEYPNCGYQIVDLPNGKRALIVHVPLPRKIMVLMMEKDEAEEVGKKLGAPSVVLP